MSSVEENKALAVRFWTGVFNDRDLSLVDRFISPDYTYNGHPNSRDQIKAYAKALWKQYPDVHFTILDVVGEADMVALRYTVEGTYSGTGRKEETMAANFVTIRDGLGVSNWQAGGKMNPVDGGGEGSGLHLANLPT